MNGQKRRNGDGVGHASRPGRRVRHCLRELRALRDQRRCLLRPSAPEPRHLVAARGLSLGKLRCDGCPLAVPRRAPGGAIPLAGARQHAATCARTSPSFPRARAPCARAQPLALAADRYPHDLKPDNLAAIKQRGLVVWAAESGDRRRACFPGRVALGAGPKSPLLARGPPSERSSRPGLDAVPGAGPPAAAAPRVLAAPSAAVHS
jgi:hypothetical protein